MEESIDALFFNRVSQCRHAIARARHELGFRPSVALPDGIRRAAEWYLAA